MAVSHLHQLYHSELGKAISDLHFLSEKGSNFMPLEAIQLSYWIISWNFYGNKKEIVWPTVCIFTVCVRESVMSDGENI